MDQRDGTGRTRPGVEDFDLAAGGHGTITADGYTRGWIRRLRIQRADSVLNPSPHPNFTVQKFNIGREGAPLLVVDNVMGNPEALLEVANGRHYGNVTSYYPGIRAKAPLSYQQFILERLRGVVADQFGLQPGTLRFTMCHFSLVTTPAEKLDYLQRIPHVDSVLGNELAMIHYLFRRDLGGTAFYRHRSTGFEYVDEARRARYLACLEDDKKGPDSPEARYINGSTALYEQLGSQQGVFNRLLMYRRTTLHSGNIAPDFVPDPDPRTGRLSINGFLAGTAAIPTGSVPNSH